MLGELRYGIFSSNSRHISNDRLTLVGLGASNINVYSTWESAIEALQSKAIDVALVDESLHDSSGAECVRKLRRHASRSLPVIMVTQDQRKDSVLDSISAGCGGYVLRPYSMETLKRHLFSAYMSASPDEIEQELLNGSWELVSNGSFDEALDGFEEIVEEITEQQNPAEELFEKGLNFLAKEKFGKAIIAFNKAIAMNEMYAEAYKGMADAYKGKGDMDSYNKYLNKSADIYAAQDSLDDVKALFIEILQNDPDAVNPFNRLGVKLRKEGDYHGAIKAYHQACTFTPNDANLYYNMARAYTYSKDYESALNYTELSLRLDPGMEPGKALHTQIIKLMEKEQQKTNPQKSTTLQKKVTIDNGE
ncbi:tetratricopeptide repeat protein [Maridesulfovibrio hydrothermalis]|uniref:Response regulator receiver protein n=1 Tax=Maridesulfovibrio hydrothermalis AM13 = DSM 14728 TaxID=1121451 RepID=L0RGW1_9BACT|nr:tetratricopeptide repeat protein [Maridesulfovibrio hydrothermalis]CCO25472.1 Response regulator receiver protein [Maridesulfovibrio hydrothermalis AM13 = DSM 14728]